MRGLVSRGQSLVKGGHFASPQIEKAVTTLKEGLNQLKDAASLRNVRLQDALEAQMVSYKQSFFAPLNKIFVFSFTREPQTSSSGSKRELLWPHHQILAKTKMQLMPTSRNWTVFYVTSTNTRSL